MTEWAVKRVRFIDLGNSQTKKDQNSKSGLQSIAFSVNPKNKQNEYQRNSETKVGDVCVLFLYHFHHLLEREGTLLLNKAESCTWKERKTG